MVMASKWRMAEGRAEVVRDGWSDALDGSEVSHRSVMSEMGGSGVNAALRLEQVSLLH